MSAVGAAVGALAAQLARATAAGDIGTARRIQKAITVMLDGVDATTGDVVVLDAVRARKRNTDE